MCQLPTMRRCPSNPKLPVLTVKNTFLEYRHSEAELQRSKSCPQIAKCGASPIWSFGFAQEESLSPKATLPWQLDDETSSITTAASDGAQNVAEFDSTPSEAGWAASSCQNPNPFFPCATVAQPVPVPAELLQSSFQAVMALPAFANPIQPQEQCSVICQQAQQCSTSLPYSARNYPSMNQLTHHYGESTHGCSSDNESNQPILETLRTASAGRRMRRKRAAKRLGGFGGREVATSSSQSHTAQDLNAELYNTIQKQLMDGGRQGVADALAAMRGKVWTFAQSPTGCRLVQLALENASQHEVGKLAEELRGHVLEATSCPHANYVLQKMLTHLHFNAAGFLAEEMVGGAVMIARNRYGCRILCRLVEFFGTHTFTSYLMDELLAEGEKLCCHGFAHHVIESLLEHGTERDRSRVMAALLTDPLAFAQHKSASYLLERALCHCCLEDKQALLARLSSPNAIAKLVSTQYGYYVARTVMKQQGPAKMRGVVQQLGKTTEGKRLVADLCLA